jgi:TRAP-type C4-dicarboxylate transport system permease small subunit
LLKAYETYKKGIAGMGKVIDVVTIFLMLAMVGVVFYQVIMRQLFSRPPIWGEEVAVTFMVWFVFLGIVLGLEEGLHIGITMFVSKLPKKAQFVIEVIVNALILLFAIILVIYGALFAYNIFSFGTALTATGMPAAVHYVVVPIAGSLMVLVALGKIAGIFINRKEAQS